MAFVERSTITELVARYRLEPSLRDVFVEGPQDRAFVSWFFTTNNIRDVTVSDIDRVDVPSGLITARGLNPGNKGAVVTLGLELCQRLAPGVPQVVCLADRDGEDVGSCESCECVYFTDYACLEMYWFDERVVGKMVLVGGRGGVDPGAILQVLAPVLTLLFAIRRANLALSLGLEWLSAERCCELTSTGAIEFDLDDFARRYLSKGGKLAALPEFGDEVKSQNAIVVPDVRMRINGHDFVALFAWYLNKTGIWPRRSSEQIAEMLAMASENAWLVHEVLFRRLLSRFT